MTQFVMRQFFTATKMYLGQHLGQQQPKAVSSYSPPKLTRPEGFRPIPERKSSTL
jgi:hypothetical protein